ncbi:hypothetical protein NW764_015957 [Fusarium oxysporum]|nr:hypothetical protein NW764_015957 [Fusarium oxysporum]
MCAPAGRLADAGYSRHTVLAGSLLSVLGIFMTSIARQYWQLLLSQGICTGLGLGIMYTPTVAVLNSYFGKRSTLALAIAAMGTGLGSILFPALLQYLTPSIGFPWAVRCVGFTALAILVLANILLKPFLPSRRSGSLIEWRSFRETPFLLFSVGSFVAYYVLFFGFFYVNVYARNNVGFPRAKAGSLLLISNGSSIAVRPLVGFIADKFLGPVNTYILSLFFLGSVLFGWIGVDSIVGMYVFSVFFGFASGACQGIFLGANASLTKDPQKVGTRFGMILSLIAFASLAGPPTAGAIIDKSNGRFLGAQLWGGSVMILGGLLIIGARISIGWGISRKA